MIRTETELMNVLAECGFDFQSTVRDLAARFPLELDWGVAGFEVVRYKLARPFAGLGDEWKIPVNRPVEYDLPPTRYDFEYHPLAEARANHEAALAKLAPLLGPGETGMAVNVYERHCQIGFFLISVTTWPRELNLRRGRNAFGGKNPYLWIAAKICFEPVLPFIDCVEPVTPDQILVGPGLDYTFDCGSLVYARRNRPPGNGSLLGLLGDSLVVSSAERTACVPLREIEGVTHLRLTPGRGGGASSVELRTMFLGRHEVRVTVIKGNNTGSLDRVAPTVAAGLGKELAVVEYPDE